MSESMFEQSVPLQKQLTHNGTWLFRWRSFLPLLFLALLLPAFRHFNFLGHSHFFDEVWEWSCFAVSLFGLGIRAYTIGHAPRRTSGRNTKAQVADQLNTTGIYSLVRNPLYLGNYCIWFGLSLYPHQWWLPVLITLIFALYHERIILAEETFLQEKFGDQFQEWAAKTPVFIPRFRSYVPSSMPFSWRIALKREYLGFFAIVALFTALETAGHILVERQFVPDAPWFCLFLGSLILFLAVRLLSKKTRFLEVSGR
jgi:protein-S-isoprenylcysteine O-methyltransferase Ste14